MFNINKISKIVLLSILLIILVTRYIYLVNEERNVNKVLVTYAGSFETANIINEIDDAVSEVSDSNTVIKEIKAEEEKIRLEEERKKQEEERKKQEEIRQRELVEQRQKSYARYDTTIDSGTASQVVNYALQFVGNPYVYAGNSLTNGTDCSGFTMLVFAHFGISLPRSAADQISAGYAVSVDSMQPGDLVLHGYNGRVSHAALYIGNGQVVHALNSNTGIVVTSAYIMPIVSVRRVL